MKPENEQELRGLIRDVVDVCVEQGDSLVDIAAVLHSMGKELFLESLEEREGE